jgi:predicted nucleic acid-binding protein
VILCDTGPLVAIIDQDDSQHAVCNSCLDEIANETLLTTWPCLTESMYLLYKADGHRAQDKLWLMIEQEALILHSASSDEWSRIKLLMARYSDAPMDLADASLVAAAEQIRLRRIFTLDRHFFAYRIHNKDSFDVVPARPAR